MGLAVHTFLIRGEIVGSMSTICQKNRWTKIKYQKQVTEFPTHHSDGIRKIASDHPMKSELAKGKIETVTLVDSGITIGRSTFEPSWSWETS